MFLFRTHKKKHYKYFFILFLFILTSMSSPNYDKNILHDNNNFIIYASEVSNMSLNTYERNNDEYYKINNIYEFILKVANNIPLLIVFIIILLIIFLGIFGFLQGYKIDKESVINKIPVIGKHIKKKEKNNKKEDVQKLLSDINILLEYVTQNEIEDIIRRSNEINTKLLKIENEFRNSAKNTYDFLLEKMLSLYKTNLIDFLLKEKKIIDKNDLYIDKDYIIIETALNDFIEKSEDELIDIFNKNGFIEFLDDITKANIYIEQMLHVIYKCFSPLRLDKLSLNNQDIKNVLEKSNTYLRPELEKLFRDLAILKNNYRSKKEKYSNELNELANKGTLNIKDELKRALDIKYSE